MSRKTMLLAIDVGNTHTVLGVFRGEELAAHWRLATQAERTADELVILLRSLLELGRMEAGEFSRAALACVVPALLEPVVEACRTLFGAEPLVVRPRIRTGMPLLVENPQEIGADRIANAVGARQRHGSPAVVVDFGTATTFDVVTARGEYAGGLIAPGLKISAEALFARAARLPRIELTLPETLIGRSTVESMRSGIFYGYLGLVDGILERLVAELGGAPGEGGQPGLPGGGPRPAAGEDPAQVAQAGKSPPGGDRRGVRIVSTGGLAGHITPHSRLIEREDPHLTLHGLKILDEKNPLH